MNFDFLPLIKSLVSKENSNGTKVADFVHENRTLLDF